MAVPLNEDEKGQLMEVRALRDLEGIARDGYVVVDVETLHRVCHLAELGVNLNAVVRQVTEKGAAS